jgi:ABC-type uncharacterized transport system permease subunit
VLYLIGATLQLRALSSATPLSARWHWLIAIPALVVHTLACVQFIFTSSGVHLGIYPISTLITVIMVAFVVVSSIRQPVHSLLILVYPLTAFSLMVASFLESTFVPLSNLAPGLVSHILISIIAYSILMMAALQSLMVGYMEHRIRSRQKITLLRLLPPLESMERLLFSMLWVGFITLTFAIGSGFMFLDATEYAVHHTVLSSASWLLYLVLLIGHHVLGWRGGAAVRWTLVAFAFLLLGYFGSKFVLEIILERAG